MKFPSPVVCVLLAMPLAMPAQNKQVQELQRDVALMQQQLKDLQSSQDKNFAAVTEIARQAVEAANRANTGVAVVTSNLEKTLESLRTTTTAPLAGINSRLNEASTELRELRQAVADQAATMSRMQQMLNDIKELAKAAQAPAAPPPQDNPGAASQTKPTMSGGDLYNSALSDMRGGKYDLALQGFNDYLKWFGEEQFAPNAQFYIGTLHYQAKNYDQAATDFDNVLEHYTRNPKTDEAMLYKGRALMNLAGRRTDGANTFKQLLRESPKSDAAKSACDELKNLGMNCTVPAGMPARPPAGKKSSKK
jgi:tol-pal system protein YbgF